MEFEEAIKKEISPEGKELIFEIIEKLKMNLTLEAFSRLPVKQHRTPDSKKWGNMVSKNIFKFLIGEEYDPRILAAYRQFLTAKEYDASVLFGN